jgi:hypothetical protein
MYTPDLILVLRKWEMQFSPKFDLFTLHSTPQSHVKGFFQPNLTADRQLLTVSPIGPFTMQISVADVNFAFKNRYLNRGRLPTNLFVVHQTESMAFQSFTTDDVLQCLCLPVNVEGLQWMDEKEENH